MQTRTIPINILKYAITTAYLKKGKTILFVLLLSIFQQSYSQSNSEINIEFLSQNSFEELLQAYSDSRDNKIITMSLAKAFLSKAKRENDSIKKAEGYYMIAENLTKSLNYNKALPYLDSAIVFSKYNYTDVYPARAHILKANIKGAQTHFTEAMDELTIANDYAQKNNNIDQQYNIKFFIALLKNNVGELEEGLSLLKESVVYRKEQFRKDSTYSHWYLHAQFALASQFNRLNQPDSALIYLAKPMALAIKLKDSVAYSRMLLSTVVSNNLKSEYGSALDSLNKYDSFIRDVEVRIGTEFRIAYWYGNIYFKQGKKEIALPYLKRMDSLAFADSFFVEGIKENYGHLISYYKEKKDTKQQLFYINRLLKVDSILDNNGTYLSQKLYKDYDTPKLIREKQQIINELESEKSNRKLMLILLSIFSVGLTALLILNYKKQKTYQKRFHELLQRTAQKKVSSQKAEQSAPSAKKLNTIDVPEDVVADILKKLCQFEDKKDYLQLDISLGNLAKQFGTNSKYLSKIVNNYQNKSFSNYINDLRINYAIVVLKTNSKYRKYTIKAIANEVGFNTTEAFSKSFFKSTGIYPSFYIKQLDKKYNAA